MKRGREVDEAKRRIVYSDDEGEEGIEDDQEQIQERRNAGAGAGPSAGPAPTRMVAGRSATDEDFFPKGSIKRIVMKNFMTYAYLEVKPGPKLNLVLGPNGTGKSSLVCALCIGLNGGPKLVARADRLTEFVRRGASAFEVVTTISSGGEGRDRVVTRKLTKTKKRNAQGETVEGHESEFMIDGVVKTGREVDALVKSLNIQFDNLCQFLPQERVQEFSSLDPYALLRLTQQALGDATLLSQHQQLIELRKDDKQAQDDVDRYTEKLARLQAEHEAQRRDYERYKRRQDLLAEAKSLRGQAAWLSAAHKLEALRAAKERYLERKAALDDARAQQEEDTEPMRRCQVRANKLRAERIPADKKAQDARMKANACQKAITQHDEELQRLSGDLGSLEEEGRKRLEGIERARQGVARAQAALDELPEGPPPEVTARLDELRLEIQALQFRQQELGSAKNEAAQRMQGIDLELGRLRARISTIGSRRYRLLQTLQGAGRLPNVATLDAWVTANRSNGTFQGPVWGPIAAELTVRQVPGLDPRKAAQYVETTCWFWLGAYIVTCREDETRLSEEASRLGAGQCKVLYSPHNPAQPYTVPHPAGPASRHAEYGIMYTVDELIEAPPMVMRVLVAQCGVNKVYIGNEQAPGNLNHLFRTGMRCVLVGDTEHSHITSHYGGTSSINNILYNGKVLAGGGSQEDAELEQLQGRERELEEERSREQAEDATITAELEQTEASRRAMITEGNRLHKQAQDIIKKRGTCRGVLETAKRTLANAERVPDPETRRPAIMAELVRHVDAHGPKCEALVKAMRVLWGALKAAGLLELQLKDVSVQLEQLKAGREERERALRAAASEEAAAKDALAAAKAEKEAAQRHAMEDWEPLSEEEKALVSGYVQSKTPVSELTQQAEAKEAEADKVVCRDMNVMEQFKKRDAQIRDQQASLQEAQTRKEQLAARIEQIRGSWLPEIRRMVATINDSFSANFKLIGCAGEVRLQESEDYDKYAIEIMVQYRASESLTQLTGARQSGGERSVATMLYLMALQSVTDTPFRVVDEINQGMDQYNERKVFNMLVESATQPDTPQCFLLTPKLLPGLRYTPDVTVVNIFNGNALETALPPAARKGKMSTASIIWGQRANLVAVA
ncbi:hypothetical protein HYH03_000984 [Edaphochlamys debaryana]|uniref:Structural maintenance of chromosomes protein 5 n=1 Tax=Edaphochlamys debaryana TaxID=47281 RepID=A0A835YNX1_9CHLO|nr:hypothetical protein HYH03_000984 [Edaphochlamys debaryana]|eukprot:KAG2501169.1 hypothetical protein HYH03_000984 [Edaphochlamys debaryana]